MTLTLKVASHNLGGEGDTVRLLELSGQESNPVSYYKSKIETVYGTDSRLLEADVICFQEFYGTASEKEPLRKKVEQAGYTIVGEQEGKGDLAVAYKTDKFICNKTGSIGSVGMGNPAFYACLEEKTTRQMVCVVSDHLEGFNAQIQKYCTRVLKNKASEPALVAQCKQKKEAVVGGDNALMNNLAALDQRFPSCPIIYGLDANATDSYLQSRLHPKRLQPFEGHGFFRDTTDIQPTIVDHGIFAEAHMNQDAALKKYDYIFARPGKGQTVTITSSAIGPEPSEFGEVLSDHRPIIATITLQQKRGFFSMVGGFLNWICSAPAALYRLFKSLFLGFSRCLTR